MGRYRTPDCGGPGRSNHLRQLKPVTLRVCLIGCGAPYQQAGATKYYHYWHCTDTLQSVQKTLFRSHSSLSKSNQLRTYFTRPLPLNFRFVTATRQHLDNRASSERRRLNIPRSLTEHLSRLRTPGQFYKSQTCQFEDERAKTRRLRRRRHLRLI